METQSFETAQLFLSWALKDRTLFIEFKDPESPESDEERRKQFMDKFKSGQIDEALKYKYRDSFLYEHASGRIEKPIYYYVLFGSSTLESADLLRRTEALKKIIPLSGPSGKPWEPFIAGCAVMNLDAWNRHLPDYPAKRISTPPL